MHGPAGRRAAGRTAAGHRWWCRGAAASLALALAVAGTTASAGDAEASLLGSTLGLVDGVVETTAETVDGLVGVVTAGWDDAATTPPVAMATVNDAIGADDLWARGIDGSGVDVAVIDTGVAPVGGLDAPGKVLNGPDLSFESQVEELRHVDTHGHGTHMAGILAGRDEHGPFRGVAPGARVVNLKVGSRDGAVDVSQLVAAIDWVVQHRRDDGMDIRVLSLSFGTDSVQDYRLDPLAHAVEVAWRAGIVVVAGGGNDGTTRPSLVNPAIDPYVVAVGAVDLQATPSSVDDRVAPFSSRGSRSRSVDVVAPGVSIAGLRNPGSSIDEAHPGAVVDGRFFRGSGTSQATAVTAGAVALLLDARPRLTPDEVKALLRASATPLVGAAAREQGAGRLDVARAAWSLVPIGATQRWERSRGTGSLEAARGTSHVADDGVELTGEVDIMGQPWKGAAWAAASAAGTSWSGGRWNGSAWTGDCWCATSWSGTSWSGGAWTGTSWTGRTWVGRTWVGRTWVGRTWVGRTWVSSAGSRTAA